MIKEKILVDTPSEWESLNNKRISYLDDLIKLLQNSQKRDFVNACVLGTLIQETS